MKLIAKQPAKFGANRPASLLTFTNGCTDLDRIKITYELRAGRKGKGRLLARQECVWGAHPQRQAMTEIAHKVEGFRLVEEKP